MPTCGQGTITARHVQTVTVQRLEEEQRVVLVAGVQHHHVP